MHKNSENQSCIACGGATAIEGHGSGGMRYKLRCTQCGERFTLAKLGYRASRASGSGVIAPPRQPQEWRPLKREPFAHAMLAMLARRG